MRRFIGLILTVVLTIAMIPSAYAAEESNVNAASGTEAGAEDGKSENSDADIKHLIIEQVYGDGGKTDAPISNSFVELYNPTDEAVDLNGYTLVCGDKTLELNGSIQANGSYLVIGAKSTDSDEYLTYDLPEADQNCDWVLDNKNFTVALKNSGASVDSVTAGSSDETKVSKQKSLKRKNHADTDTDADFSLINWKKADNVVTDDYIKENAPRNFKGAYGKVHSTTVTPEPTPTEPTYTPVVASDEKVKGYYNDTASLKAKLVGRYNSGAMNADGGSLEIVQYNSNNGFAYAVSGVKGKLIAINLNSDLKGDKVTELSGTEYDIKEIIADSESFKNFEYGDMTSVAISPDGSKAAVAVQAKDYNKNGVVALFECQSDGSLVLLSIAYSGVQPDMITFANDKTILTADEGEPRNGKDNEDPKGSVSVFSIDEDNTLTSEQIFFDEFDSQRTDLVNAGVLIQKDTAPSTDFEPEYISVNGNSAYVSLQEANAIAVLDIEQKKFSAVYPLGFQDYGTTKIDLQKNEKIEFNNYANVYGIKMPDGISTISIGGKTYLITANEGDSRSDWQGLDNEYENKTSKNGQTLDKKVVWFNTDLWDGLDSTKDYVFGGRSFSVYEVSDSGITPVFDSGSGFEEITAEKIPEHFNCSNDKIDMDNRSGKKGPEPESVVTGVVGGKAYAFTALERIGGIMIYSIADPQNTAFVNYINSREFDDKIKGDVSPEGLCFVSADKSKTGTPLLLAACEVSGTLAVYELSEKKETGSSHHSSGGGTSRYTIKFETNGGSNIDSVRVARNKTLTEPNAPTKDGYVFDGWYTDKELKTKYDFSEKVTKGFTLYAGWTEKDNSENQLILKIGEKSAQVFGNTKKNEVTPIIRNDRTMLPARFIAENLGAKVEWNGEKELVTITGKNLKTGEDVTILITIGAINAVVNGKDIKLDSPAFVENDRTYTPIRFISEHLGTSVEWIEKEQKVIITKTGKQK